MNPKKHDAVLKKCRFHLYNKIIITCTRKYEIEVMKCSFDAVCLKAGALLRMVIFQLCRSRKEITKTSYSAIELLQSVIRIFSVFVRF